MAVTSTQAVSYLGELFQSGKRPNNFLRMIGGIQGGVMETTSREFPVSVLYSLRAPAQPANLEGAAAPAATSRTLTQATNVIQIHQETVSLTYLGASDKTVSGVVPLPQGRANGPVNDPRSEGFQVQTILDTISQDVNFSFLQGAFANPADPTGTALKTRGILTAITTTSFDHSGDTGSAVTATQLRGYVNELIKGVVVANGYNPDETWTLMADATTFGNVLAAFEAAGTIYLSPESEYAGIKVRKILTRFGLLNVVMEPDMTANYMGLFNLGVVAPVGLPVAGKGILFAEPLAKTGSADNIQIYGQIGIDHGPEFAHGKTKLATGISI